MLTATRITTLKEVCELVEQTAWSFGAYSHTTFSRGRPSTTQLFDIMADDVPGDTRLCIRVECYGSTTYITVRVRYGYNAERHIWVDEGEEYRTEIEGRKGRKQLLELSQRLLGPARSRSVTRRNGKWE